MKTFLPLVLISILLFGCGKAHDTGADFRKQEVQRKQQLLKHKKAQLADAKEKQNTMQNIFNDSDEVDALQADIKAIEEGIKENQKEIRNLEAGYLAGVKKAILAGFFTTLIFMVILALVSQMAFFGTGELQIILGWFFIFWLVFSIAIKFVFY